MDRRSLLVGLAALPLASRAWGAGMSAPFGLDSLSIDNPQFDAKAARAAGMDAAVIDLEIYPRNRQAALDALEDWRRAFRAPGAAIGLVETSGDFARLRAAGRFAVVLACQDAAILDVGGFSVGDMNLDNLEELHAKGLRALQLTHNERNAVGEPFTEPADGGLSRLGGAVVRRMNELGMLVDLSHCSERTTAAALALSTRPCAVTHAGCRALHPSARNKTDLTIRRLADKGGYFGVFMMSRWLTEADHASADTVVDHIDHAVKVGGIDCVGFGSDQPIAGDPAPQAEKVAQLANYQTRNAGQPGAEPLHGHVTVAEMDKPDRMEVLRRALERRGYRGERLDKVMGLNFVRVFAAACDSSRPA